MMLSTSGCISLNVILLTTALMSLWCLFYSMFYWYLCSYFSRIFYVFFVFYDAIHFWLHFFECYFAYYCAYVLVVYRIHFVVFKADFSKTLAFSASVHDTINIPTYCLHFLFFPFDFLTPCTADNTPSRSSITKSMSATEIFTWPPSKTPLSKR